MLKASRGTSPQANSCTLTDGKLRPRKGAAQTPKTCPPGHLRTLTADGRDTDNGIMHAGGAEAQGGEGDRGLVKQPSHVTPHMVCKATRVAPSLQKEPLLGFVARLWVWPHSRGTAGCGQAGTSGFPTGEEAFHRGTEGKVFQGQRAPGGFLKPHPVSA